MKPDVTAFFDQATNTATYGLRDTSGRACANIDSVLDFGYASGRTDTRSADAVVAFIRAANPDLRWILETRVQADHLSAAPYLQAQLGGKIGTGAHITEVQATFGKVFNEGADFQRDGSQFDQLFAEGDSFHIGQLRGDVMHTPGHTPACMTFVIGDAALDGDTLFMPDFGTARCDSPGGSAAIMYASVQRISALPDATRVFVCHDHKAPGREKFCLEKHRRRSKAPHCPPRCRAQSGGFRSPQAGPRCQPAHAPPDHSILANQHARRPLARPGRGWRDISKSSDKRVLAGRDRKFSLHNRTYHYPIVTKVRPKLS